MSQPGDQAAPLPGLLRNKLSDIGKEVQAITKLQHEFKDAYDQTKRACQHLRHERVNELLTDVDIYHAKVVRETLGLRVSVGETLAVDRPLAEKRVAEYAEELQLLKDNIERRNNVFGILKNTLTLSKLTTETSKVPTEPRAMSSEAKKHQGCGNDKGRSENASNQSASMNNAASTLTSRENIGQNSNQSHDGKEHPLSGVNHLNSELQAAKAQVAKGIEAQAELQSYLDKAAKNLADANQKITLKEAEFREQSTKMLAISGKNRELERQVHQLRTNILRSNQEKDDAENRITEKDNALRFAKGDLELAQRHEKSLQHQLHLSTRQASQVERDFDRLKKETNTDELRRKNERLERQVETEVQTQFSLKEEIKQHIKDLANGKVERNNLKNDCVFAANKLCLIADFTKRYAQRPSPLEQRVPSNKRQRALSSDEENVHSGSSLKVSSAAHVKSGSGAQARVRDPSTPSPSVKHSAAQARSASDRYVGRQAGHSILSPQGDRPEYPKPTEEQARRDEAVRMAGAPVGKEHFVKSHWRKAARKQLYPFSDGGLDDDNAGADGGTA